MRLARVGTLAFALFGHLVILGAADDSKPTFEVIKVNPTYVLKSHANTNDWSKTTNVWYQKFLQTPKADSVTSLLWQLLGKLPKDDPILEGPLTDGTRLSVDSSAMVIFTPSSGTWALLHQFPLRSPEIQLLPLGSFAIGKAPGGFDIGISNGRLISTKRLKEFKLYFYTAHGVATGHGTEVAFEVTTNGTLVTVFEGNVELGPWPDNTNSTTRQFVGNIRANPPLSIRLTPEGDIKPIRFASEQIVQWWLYYPSVLVWEELPTSFQTNALFEPSLQAYQRGNLARARDALPTNSVPPIPGEAEFRAALDIAAGNTDVAGLQLQSTKVDQRLASALSNLVAAIVRDRPISEILTNNALASEWLAMSWVEQSKWQIPAALAAAQRAKTIRPNSGLVLARVAQLEFALGNLAASRNACDSALAISPDQITALTIRGFLAAAENKPDDARRWFDKAIAIDPSNGEPYFGRGLVYYHERKTKAALTDLVMAARLQRDRAMFRAYLGYFQTRESRTNSIDEELHLATQLDPGDPTGWWFLGLEEYRKNRVNDAVQLLGRAIDANDNRAINRSRRLLQADRALRQTGLARVFERAGLPELALREASLAVVNDAASPSAHLFLADSYSALRDPTRFQLRYDTLWLNELLLANVLAPVGIGPVSTSISQDEYSRLLDKDGYRASSWTEARSDGVFREVASQSGSFGNSSYAFDIDWQHNNPKPYRGSLDRWEGYAQYKHQFGLQDTGLLFTRYGDFSSGDNFQRYDPYTLPTDASFHEWQQPITVGMWRHEWSAENQTLAMFGHVANRESIVANDIVAKGWAMFTNYPVLLLPTVANFNYRSDVKLWVGELAHIAQSSENTLFLGSRWQSGTIRTDDHIEIPVALSPPLDSHSDEELRRVSIYAYDFRRVPLPKTELTLIGGLAFDQIDLPANLRQSPISQGSKTVASVLPKGGMVWRISEQITARGIYAQSVSGVTWDDSFRLEPVQLAGFPQSYRTLIPASSGGPLEGQRVQSYGSSLDFSLSDRVFAGLSVHGADSHHARQTGAIVTTDAPDPISMQTEEKLDYSEHSLNAWLGRLVGQNTFMAADFSYKRVTLNTDLATFEYQTRQESTLYRAGVRMGMNFTSGWFWQIDSHGYWQRSLSASGDGLWRNDRFEQSNLILGWRFPNLRGEISFGVYNLSGRDYRLDPLSQQPEFARERTIFARLRFEFGPYNAN